jgi:predicted permease
MRQLKLAFRTLFKTPFVTTVAILSLALGIGANAAIYSLFNQMLLQPLPVTNPGELVNVASPGPRPGSNACGQAGDCDEVFSYPMFRDLEGKQSVLSGLAAHVTFGLNLSYNQQPINGDGMLVSGSYFPTLGLKPALGRLLGPSDDQAIGTNFVTVLSYRFWETRLGSDPDVLNKPIILNGQSMTIVGVAPDGFDGTTLGVQPMVFVPITMGNVLKAGHGDFESRRSYWIYLFGRLKPGVTMDQAAKGLNALYRPILSDVEAPLQKGMSDATLVLFKKKEITLAPGQRGQSSIHREAKTPLYMLFGITGIVLLIACANIANLLLARGANRSMEMSVRLALGASRGQLLAQLMTESVVLSLMGGVASLLVARWTLAGIAALLPPEAARTIHFGLQPSVLLFAAALAVGTGLLFGLFPALHSTRPDLVTSIRANAGQISGARAASRFRATLVTAQIALSMALLISAGLFVKSLINVSNVDLGLHVDNVVTFGISPTLSGYDSTRSAVLFERLEDELSALPGVTGVTSAAVPLLAGNNWGNSVNVQGFKSGPDVDASARFNEVSNAYLGTLGMKMAAGREFTRGDIKGSGKVAIINETFAKKFNLGNDAVGKFMSRGSDTLDIQIVGVMKDAKYSAVKQIVPPVFMIPWRQDAHVGSLSFYVRTAQASSSALLRAIPGVMKKLDPTIPIEELKTMPQQIKQNVFLDRMISILSASFAILATLLAGVGLYGVLAYTVALRTREFGVRMALGADARRVGGMVLRQVTWMMVIGGTIGIAAALALGRAAKSLLFGIEGNDPAVFVISVALLALVAFAAGYLPARRASQVDPMQALRYE